MNTHCPVCGEHLDRQPEAAAEIDVAAEVTAGEVRIAEIQAKRDVDLAKISRGISENELVVENAALEAANEVLEDVVNPQPAELPVDPEVVPVIVDVDAGGDAVNEEDAGTDLAPGIDEEHHESKHRAGIGMW